MTDPGLYFAAILGLSAEKVEGAIFGWIEMIHFLPVFLLLSVFFSPPPVYLHQESESMLVLFILEPSLS